MRRAAVLLVVLTALAAPSAASGQSGGVSEEVSVGDALDFVEVPLRVTGAVSVDFRGDEAAGCAAARMCGFSGTVTWNPAGPGTLLVFGYR